jgi:hypothetical protein
MTRRISKKAHSFINRKIRKLRHEKYPEKQAVAIAYAMARDHGFKVPRKPHNPDHHDHR